jgi:trehalose synthase
MAYVPTVTGVDDYEPLVGAETIQRLRKKAKAFQGLRVVHVNSTYYGGGVAEILSSLTLLLNDLGIRTGWRAIHGPPDFFSVTKKMHNALQGKPIRLTRMKKRVYEGVVYENAIRNHLDHDFVVVHDPQPLPLVQHYRRRGPWVWRCHLDLSQPDPDLWSYLKPFIERYDAAIFSIPDYRQDLRIPQVFFMPAIDPFSYKNRELPESEIEGRLRRYKIPTDLPLVVQISRFDPWKDPKGVIEAVKLAREEVPCTLVLLGNVATDDPEGEVVYSALKRAEEERIRILCQQDSALVNALQRRAAVVIQKSLREGFGLTVTEAMWKGTPVIAGNVGGIRYQIQDGINGFLVSSVEETAQRLVELLRNEEMRRAMGQKARETVRRRFLMTRLVEQYLDLFGGFEAEFRLMAWPPVPQDFMVE